MESIEHLTEKAKRDYALVQNVLKKQDKDAFAEILSHYRDSLYFLMLKMTKNPIDAEDLTIEAFGKAFKNLHQYKPNYAFSTWLFKIATNNCIDHIRSKNKNLLLSLDESIDETEKSDFHKFISDENANPEKELIDKQKALLLRKVVARLKPHYRLLIEYRYFDELSYDEIANKLEMPLGSVKAKLFRAREFLYQLLKTSKDVL